MRSRVGLFNPQTFIFSPPEELVAVVAQTRATGRVNYSLSPLLVIWAGSAEGRVLHSS